MRVTGIDARNLRRQGTGTYFVVFIYEGSEESDKSWAVDSCLLTDAAGVLEWLRNKLPRDACYSVGVVTDPPRPTAASDMHLTWVLGADLLNKQPRHWTSTEHRIAEGMLARRNRVTI